MRASRKRVHAVEGCATIASVVLGRGIPVFNDGSSGIRVLCRRIQLDAGKPSDQPVGAGDAEGLAGPSLKMMPRTTGEMTASVSSPKPLTVTSPLTRVREPCCGATKVNRESLDAQRLVPRVPRSGQATHLSG